MSRSGVHAEDIEHELDHAGRDLGESFADTIGEPLEPAEAALLDPESPVAQD